MTRLASPPILLLGVTLLVGACSDDDAAPPALEESFVLTTVAGEDLPYSFRYPVSNAITVVIQRDEIRFFDDGSWQRRQIWAEIFDGEEHQRSLDTEGEVRQGFEGSVLWYRCRDEASCVPSDVFVVLEGALAMETAWLWPGATSLRYREVERTQGGG